MADLINVGQFEARLGRSLTATQLFQAESLIADASALVVDIVNDVAVTDTWDVGSVPPAVVPVVVSMVRRAIDNPAGFSQQSAGSFSVSSPNTSGLFATRDEIRAVRKAAGTSGIASLNLDSYLLGTRVSWLDGAL